MMKKLDDGFDIFADLRESEMENIPPRPVHGSWQCRRPVMDEVEAAQSLLELSVSKMEW